MQIARQKGKLAVGAQIHVGTVRRVRAVSKCAIPAAMNPTNDSPLALRFEDALQPSVFLTQLRTSAESQAKRELASLGNDALKPALAGAKFVLDSRGMQVVFEGGIPKGAKLMRDIAGKALPTLVDGKTGKIVKIARGASSSRKVVSAAAGTALVIVEAAHMISGYDNAQRLKKVEGAVDALVHAHKSELKSRLEAIYSHSKERIGGDLNRLSEHDQNVLYGKCEDLVELRARWRDDFRHRLGQIKTAEPGFMNKVLWWRKDEAHRKDREAKAKDAVDALEVVQLMHFSLMLQMSLAGASGHLEDFQKFTLPDECHKWSALMKFTSERAGEICGTSDPAEFAPFLEAVSDLVRFWSPNHWKEERRRLVFEREKEQMLGCPYCHKERSLEFWSCVAVKERIVCPACSLQFRFDGTSCTA